MVRRWIIRGFFLALLMMWAAGWAVSTRYEVGGGYVHGGTWLVGSVRPGVVTFTWYRGVLFADGWNRDLLPHPFRLIDFDFWWYRVSSADADSTSSSFSLVGFSYAHASYSRTPPVVWHTVRLPFWFLLLVSGIALRWAWRKSRPQPSPATAFPVEMKGDKS